MESALRFYRHRLPHWRAEGAIYFVTWRLRADSEHLSPEERTMVVSALRLFDGDRYDLMAFVVMNDHVHVVVEPLQGRRLEDIVHSGKSYTAHQVQKHRGRSGAFWLSESFDRVIRDEAELEQKVTYVLGNPFRRWPELASYEWVGTRFED